MALLKALCWALIFIIKKIKSKKHSYKHKNKTLDNNNFISETMFFVLFK
jgi:hypothetical protein